MKASIRAIEYYLPLKTENGDTLKKENPDWRIEDIEKKTGIKVRHIATSEQSTIDMATQAAEKLFEARVKKTEIDFLILVTQSPDYVLPTSACVLQDRLGLSKSCMAFDINLGCSGFIYGLAIGSSLVESGMAKQGILVCSETYTKYINLSDRTCRPIFSDGAAATLIAASSQDLLGPFDMGSDGSGFRDLIVPMKPESLEDTVLPPGQLFMNGSKVFMFTMNKVPKCVNTLLEKSKKNIDEIDLFVFHQASKFVMDSIIRRLKLPEEKVFINYDRIGNTVSATIPIALKDAITKNRLKKGDQVMLVGFGVGLSWGGCMTQWDI